MTQAQTQQPEARQKWTDACMDQFSSCGIDADTARECAESLAESQQEWNGDDPAEWDDPKDAADDEMSYWGD